MKNSRFLWICLVLIFSASAALAQAEKTPVAAKGKVVMVDEGLFEDRTRGIKKLVRAWAKVRPGGESDVSVLTAQITVLQREITTLLVENKPINETYQKQRELTKKVNQNQFEFRRLYQLHVQPVRAEIEKKAKEFAVLRGYAVILDKGILDVALVGGVIDDVTEEFIKFCNDAFEKEKS